MSRVLRAILVSACLGVAAHLSAAGAFAQDGDIPTLSTDDIPTMTTDDAAGPQPAPAPASADVDQFWQRVYDELGRSPDIPGDEVAKFREVIEGGRMIGFAVTFDVGPGGSMQNFVLEQSTGLPSLDASLRQMATQTLPRAARSGGTTKNVRVEAGISKARVRFSVASDAPSEAEAIRFEREMEKFRAEAPLPPSQRHLLDGVGVTRDGTRVRLDVDLPIAAVVSLAASGR